MEGRPPAAESELVERARNGDVSAFEQIVQTHQTIAFRTAYLLTRDAGDAEEATQDAFVKAYRALGRFRAGAPLRPWLLRIVANEAHNRRRAAARRANVELRAAETEPSGGAAPSPEAALLDAERREALLAGLSTLREEERLVVALRYFLDLSETETAAALGIRPGTVKSRLSRALERLRARNEEDDG